MEYILHIYQLRYTYPSNHSRLILLLRRRRRRPGIIVEQRPPTAAAGCRSIVYGIKCTQNLRALLMQKKTHNTNTEDNNQSAYRVEAIRGE